jgi:hypothetical protein
MSRRALALATVVVLALPAAAWGTTFRGAAVEDAATPVTLRVSKAGVVRFDYSNVLVECSNGDEIREPGAQHSTMVGEENRFRDLIAQDLDEGATGESFIKGRLLGRKAVGVLKYELLYEGGSCESGKVHWKAKRKKFPRPG